MVRTSKKTVGRAPSGPGDSSREVGGPPEAWVLEAKPSVLSVSRASLLQTRIGTWLESHGSLAAWIGVEIVIVVLVANFVPSSHKLEKRATLANGDEEVLVANFRGYSVIPLAVMYLCTTFTVAHSMNKQLFMEAMWHFEFHVVFWSVLFAMGLRFANFYSLFGDDCGAFSILTYIVPLLGYIPIAIVTGSIDCMELQRWVKMMATGLFAGHLVFLHIWIDYLDDQEWPAEAMCSFDVPCTSFKSLYKSLLFSTAMFLFRASAHYCFGSAFATLRPQYIFGESKTASRGVSEETPSKLPETPIPVMPRVAKPSVARSSKATQTADVNDVGTDDAMRRPLPRPQLQSVFDSGRRTGQHAHSSERSEAQPPKSMKPTMLRDAFGMPLHEERLEPSASLQVQTPPPTTAASGKTSGSSKDHTKGTPFPEEVTNAAEVDRKVAGTARLETSRKHDAVSSVSATPDDDKNPQFENDIVQAPAEPETQSKAELEGSGSPSRADGVKVEDASCRQPQATGESNGNIEGENNTSSGPESVPHGGNVGPPPIEFSDFRELCVYRASQTCLEDTPVSSSSGSSVQSAANESQLRQRLAALVDCADMTLASEHKRFRDELTKLVANVLQALDEKDKFAVALWHNTHGEDMYRLAKDVSQKRTPRP